MNDITVLRSRHSDLGRGLSGLQIQIIEELFLEPKLVNVAEKFNITPKTLYSWLHSPEFASALSERESAILQSSVRRMLTILDDATTLMADALAGKVKLTSDQRFIVELVSKRLPILLDQSLVMTRLADLQQKLASLE